MSRPHSSHCKSHRVAHLALAALLATSCSVPPSAERQGAPVPEPKVPVSASDGIWALTSSTFIGAGRIPGVPRATLAFENGRISAFSGCNTAHAAAYHRDGRLDIAALNTTRRACPEPLGSFEARFFRLLRAQPVYRVEGNTMMLVDGDRNARFRRLAQGKGGGADRP